MRDDRSFISFLIVSVGGSGMTSKHPIPWERRFAVCDGKALHGLAVAALPALAVGVLRDAAIRESGSTRVPTRRTDQCKWGPVTRPVAPTRPTISPRATLSPGFTEKRDRCAK